MATTDGNFTMTSTKFNTVVVYRGTYRSILLNTVVYHDTLFLAVPSPSIYSNISPHSNRCPPTFLGEKH